MTTAADEHSGDLSLLSRADLEARLRDAEETLQAIRNGEVDAVIVHGVEGHQVYTLESADRPYRILVEQMQEGALTISEDGTVLYCNRRLAAILRKPQETIIGGTILDHIPRPEREAFDRLLEKSADGGGKGEFNLQMAGGETLPVYLSLVDLPDEDHRVICGIVTDLTQQKQRRMVETSLQIALEASEMGSWDLDLASDTSHRSSRHDRIFGYSQPLEKWGRASFADHILEEDRPAVSEAFATAARTSVIDFECRIRRADDGAIRWIRVRGRTFYFDGEPVRMAGVVADITDLRQMEDQLRQALKMEAVGQLTGGLAHDFNNLLTVILGNLERVQEDVSDDRLARLVGYAYQAAEKGARLTHQLLSFSRRQSLQSQAISVNAILPGLGLLIERAIGEHIELELVEAEGLWHCEADPNQLESAVLNLALNARDAMPKGGRITLGTANVTLNEQDAAKLQGATTGRYVVVSVEDTGDGMTPDVLSRAFEPFFTTKEVGKGSGLGLSMVYGFARQSDGYVEIDSKIGVGTTIKIYLPWTEAAVVEDVASTVRTIARAQPVAVLAVEDDEDVRRLVAQQIRDLGHTVVEADSGPAALAMLRQRPDIRLMITDIVMPKGMTGVELAREAVRICPDLAVLLSSGFASVSTAPTEGGRDFPLLRKPYKREDLEIAIDTALAQATAGAPSAREDGERPFSPEGLRVLVVEDEPLISMLLEDYLEGFGSTVVGPSATLDAAWSETGDGRFDIALLDVNLGSEPVYPLADHLMERKIPFVFMTGHDVSSLPEKYRRTVCLTKPYSDADVRRAMAAAMAIA